MKLEDMPRAILLRWGHGFAARGKRAAKLGLARIEEACATIARRKGTVSAPYVNDNAPRSP